MTASEPGTGCLPGSIWNSELPMPAKGHSRLGRPSSKSYHVGCSAESGSKFPCFQKRCYSQIVDTTPTGSGSLLDSKEHGRTFRRNEIARTRSASARICIVREIWSNGSSTRSSNVGVSRPDTTSSLPTTWPSSSSHQSEFGYALMSPRPNTGHEGGRLVRLKRANIDHTIDHNETPRGRAAG